MGYSLLNIRPEIVYHYTKKEKLQQILQKGRIMRFGLDKECWFCLSLQDTLRYMELTVMREGGTYIDAYLKAQIYPPFNASEYVILELRPIAPEKYDWVRWKEILPASATLQRRKETEERSALQVGFRANLRFYPNPKVYEVDELLKS